MSYTYVVKGQAALELETLANLWKCSRNKALERAIGLAYIAVVPLSATATPQATPSWFAK